jgi:hypothetical protein
MQSRLAKHDGDLKKPPDNGFGDCQIGDLRASLKARLGNRKCGHDTILSLGDQTGKR